MELNKIYNMDCWELIGTLIGMRKSEGGWGDLKFCIVTDPPFNVGYHYDGYDDDMDDDEYYTRLGEIFTTLGCPVVCIHYPEELYKIAFQIGEFPEKVVSWVYNSNTAKQHRDIAFFNVVPDFKKVTQPYKNPKDKRIQKLIAVYYQLFLFIKKLFYHLILKNGIQNRTFL